MKMATEEYLKSLNLSLGKRLMEKFSGDGEQLILKLNACDSCFMVIGQIRM